MDTPPTASDGFKFTTADCPPPVPPAVPQPCEPQPVPVMAEEPLTEEAGNAAPQEQPQASDSSEELPPLFTPAEASAAPQEILQALARLEEKFDEKIVRDHHKEQLFDKMYAELTDYKTDLYAKLLKPLVNGLISLLDDTQTIAARADEADFDPARAVKYVKNLTFDIRDLLEFNGVEIYTDESETFNPRTQRATGQVPTDDPAADNRIASRRRPGYRWNGIILHPEMVTIYKCKKQ